MGLMLSAQKLPAYCKALQVSSEVVNTTVFGTAFNQWVELSAATKRMAELGHSKWRVPRAVPGKVLKQYSTGITCCGTRGEMLLVQFPATSLQQPESGCDTGIQLARTAGSNEKVKLYCGAGATYTHTLSSRRGGSCPENCISCLFFGLHPQAGRGSCFCPLLESGFDITVSAICTGCHAH